MQQDTVKGASVKRRGNPYRDANGKMSTREDAVYKIDSDGSMRHLPGKHNQKTHGHGNGAGQGFGEFTKRERQQVDADGNTKTVRVWSTKEGSQILVSDDSFPDQVVTDNVIPTVNKLQSTHPLPGEWELDMRIMPKIPAQGGMTDVDGLAIQGTGMIYLNGPGLRDTKQTAHDISSDPKNAIPAGKNVPAIEYVITHEWGHAIDKPSPKQDGLRDKAFEDTVMAKSVSDYSEVNPAEAYAENFAQFVLSNGKPGNQQTEHYAEVFEW